MGLGHQFSYHTLASPLLKMLAAPTRFPRARRREEREHLLGKLHLVPDLRLSRNLGDGAAYRNR